MPGVEILNTITHYQMKPSILFWVCLILTLIPLLIWAIIESHKKESNNFDYIIFAFICLLVLNSIVFVGTMEETDKIKYIEYQVTIDDSVSMKDFTEKYEIVKQSGKIYTVIEKDSNK